MGARYWLCGGWRVTAGNLEVVEVVWWWCGVLHTAGISDILPLSLLSLYIIKYMLTKWLRSSTDLQHKISHQTSDSAGGGAGPSQNIRGLNQGHWRRIKQYFSEVEFSFMIIIIMINTELKNIYDDRASIKSFFD